MTADITSGKLSDAARQALERYVRELRFLLQGCPTVDAAEVEAEVRQHIDQELADAPQPVSSERLDAILTRLGSPTQWVPIDELPWWRRTMIRLRMGPSSDRWALGVFIVWALGLLLLPAEGFGLLLLFVSFLLARAVVAMSDEAGSQLVWRRWLVYPSLLTVYIPLLAAVMFWAASAAAIPLFRGAHWRRDLQPEEVARLEDPFTVIFSGAAGLGAWWVIVGAALVLFPRLPQWLFNPFFRRSARKLGVVLLAVGMLSALIGGFGVVVWDP
ncbi:MAG: hypothetical protein WBD40_10790 [Tepidisphaeraceae bacterium]